MLGDFRPSRRPTLGVEWELGLVDAGTGGLFVSAAAEVVEEARAGIPAGESRVHRELLRNTVEGLVTGICESVPEAAGDLRESRDVVRRVARQRGLEIFRCGTHPFARWYDQEVSEGERYAALIERTQWWGRNMLIFGVHVHVGVDAVGKVLPILNGLLRWFPHLQAVSASSPFWGGADTGYASNRALMFQQLPTAGLPFQFSTWAQFEAYVGDMLATGVISEFKEIRWDIRPSPALGTIEVRIFDGLPTLEEVAAIAALTHCLVVDLDQQARSRRDAARAAALARTGEQVACGPVRAGRGGHPRRPEPRAACHRRPARSAQPSRAGGGVAGLLPAELASVSGLITAGASYHGSGWWPPRQAATCGRSWTAWYGRCATVCRAAPPATRTTPLRPDRRRRHSVGPRTAGGRLSALASCLDPDDTGRVIR